jgi:glutaconate CoA-transferase subunit A
LESKLASPEQVCELIKSQSKVIFGGNGVRGHPMGVIRELARRKVRGLQVVGYANGLDVDLLAGAGCIDHLVTSYVGLETFGLAPNFRRSAQEGTLKVLDYPELMERFWAGAYKMPFFPNTDIFGSDLVKKNEQIKEGVSPLDGQPFVAIPPARADVAVIHAQMADEFGNILYKHPKLMTTEEDIWFSRCADKLIVTVERIVDHKYVRTHPHMNMIPFYRTTAVVHMPFGAHPGACDYFYDYDREHMATYVDHGQNREKFEQYLNEFVYGVRNHSEYLEKVGPTERLLKLQTAEAFFL